ncbi:MAG: hypothetical protein AAF549_02385, partial [Pseudomonadota bacterium]
MYDEKRGYYEIMDLIFEDMAREEQKAQLQDLKHQLINPEEIGDYLFTISGHGVTQNVYQSLVRTSSELVLPVSFSLNELFAWISHEVSFLKPRLFNVEHSHIGIREIWSKWDMPGKLRRPLAVKEIYSELRFTLGDPGENCEIRCASKEGFGNLLFAIVPNFGHVEDQTKVWIETDFKDSYELQGVMALRIWQTMTAHHF